MITFLSRHWWKLLCVLLLSYTVWAGLATPLGAGIKAISPSSIQIAGETEIYLATYNVSYKQDVADKTIQARLRLNKDQAICVDRFEIDPYNNLVLGFNIPDGNLPVDISSPAPNKNSPYPLLEISSQQNGYTSVKSAVIFDKIGPNPSAEFCKAETYPNSTGGKFPFLNILEESIRNLFFHVPMWFGMMLLMLISSIYSIQQLRQPQQEKYDVYAKNFALVGLLYGILGIVTGALWARYTWLSWWGWDVKQNTSAIALLIYAAYFVLRGSFEDVDKQARISAIYNIFAFATLIPLLYIVPRMMDSLHPGMGGNPAFSSYDLDNNLRMVFYPSIIGWILLGIWTATISIRIELLERKKQQQLEREG